MTPLTLDHVVIAVRDLDAAQRDYIRLLGREASWRGKHPTYGTENVLFRLNNCYIELLAPAPDGDDSLWRSVLVEHLDAQGDGLYAIALGTNDIEPTVALGREHGLSVDDPAPGEGVDLITGARRRWRNARIAQESTRGVIGFFIQHDSPPDALPSAKPVAADGAFVQGIDHTVIASSDLQSCRAVWEQTFGIEHRLSVDRPGGRRLHFLRFAEGVDGYGSILELAGEAEPQQAGASDALWGVSYRVGDVAATVARLRAEGVYVSDVRPGNAPGTFVADLKPGFSRDVRTLLIQRNHESGTRNQGTEARDWDTLSEFRT